MPLQVVCPNPECRKTMMIKDELAGQALRCPACKAKFSAPSRSDAPAASKPAKDPLTIPSTSSARPPLAKAPLESDGGASRKPTRGGQREELPASIGPYQVSRELGRGAFGVVYMGHDPKLKRDVAVKVLNRDALHSNKAVERFLREAQVVAQMHHNHIVPVYELGEHEDSHYIASRFVPGKTLSDVIPEEGVGAVEAVGLILQLLEALTYAHEMNVLHRDVKPANAIVDAKGQLFLMDFGLAGWVGQTDGRATQDGTVMGTPSYMPPEQARGDMNNVRETADQYSAGVVLYELLTGHVPFEGGPMVVLLHNVINTPPPRPSEFRADLDPQLEEICLKALAKRPEERYPSCRAFADALRIWQTLRDSPYPIAVATIVEPISRGEAGVESALTQVADPGGKRQTHGDALSGAEAPAGSPAREKATAATALVSAEAKKKVLGTLQLAAVGGGVVALVLALVVLTGRFLSQASPVQPPKPGDKPAPLTGNNTAAQVRQAQEAWAKYLGREVEEDHEVAPGVKMKFVLIPPGTFWMGSPEGEKGHHGTEEEQHEVTLTEPFYLGKYEVTQEQYEALVSKEKNGSRFKGADLPVENLAWIEADGYAKEWTRKAGSKDTYRLPTEAEWEYSCRGGAFSKDSLPFSLKSGPSSSLSDGQINFDGNFPYPYGDGKQGKNLKRTAPVGSFPESVNAFGLADMHGNVWEWCGDWYEKYQKGHVTNPTGPLNSGASGVRVCRGGSWLTRGEGCRAASRRSYSFTPGDFYVGLRLALVPSGS
jgi:serine/threonine protein kinase/formylglycine-generating enzyme required for sulfatase activity